MPEQAPVMWSPESGWVCSPPSALPGPAVVALMRYALSVYDQRLRGVGPGPRREAMVVAVEQLRAMVQRGEPCTQQIVARGETALFKADQGYQPSRLISIGG